MYCEIQPEPSGNPSGSALGISLGLRLYFTVYPSSHHNTDTVSEGRCYKSPVLLRSSSESVCCRTVRSIPGHPSILQPTRGEGLLWPSGWQPMQKEDIQEALLQKYHHGRAGVFLHLPHLWGGRAFHIISWTNIQESIQ